jgi:hypothetical protein
MKKCMKFKMRRNGRMFCCSRKAQYAAGLLVLSPKCGQRPNFGVYTPDDPKAFVGRVRSRSIFGFQASEIRNNKSFVNGHKGIFALTALITAMPYFRSLDDQRSFKMIML